MAQRAPVVDTVDVSLDEIVRAYDRSGPIPVSEATYLRLALADDKTKWELHDGILVEKPSMPFGHGDNAFYLAFQIASQVDPKRYRLRTNAGHVQWSDQSYFIPDVMVIPVAILGPEIHRYDVLERYREALPFVAEVWSPSTGDYDSNVKVPIYRRRGDLEIWRVHPFDRIVTIWQRQPDGRYEESTVTGGRIQLHALPEVTIDLDALFASVS